MDDRFDRLENMIVDLGKDLGAKIDHQGKSLGTRIDEQGERLGARIDDQGRSVGRRIDELSNRVSVLHEDVKSDFRFSLEARQALKEVLEAGFANQERAFRSALAPIEDAVRSIHRK